MAILGQVLLSCLVCGVVRCMKLIQPAYDEASQTEPDIRRGLFLFVGNRVAISPKPEWVTGGCHMEIVPYYRLCG